MGENPPPWDACKGAAKAANPATTGAGFASDQVWYHWEFTKALNMAAGFSTLCFLGCLEQDIPSCLRLLQP